MSTESCEGEGSQQEQSSGAQEAEQRSGLESSSFMEDFGGSSGITQELLHLCATPELKGLASHCGILATIADGTPGGAIAGGDEQQQLRQQQQQHGQLDVAVAQEVATMIPVASAGAPRASPAEAGVAGKRISPESSPVNAQRQTPKKKRRTMSAEEKKQKGLRHFSMLVLQKVEELGETTYNEVADAIVASLRDKPTADMAKGKPRSDQNIKRRVYDALNVLQAMNIIEKQKKAITWVGLPSQSTTRVQELQDEKAALELTVEQKREALRETKRQVELYSDLARRNELNPDLPMEKRISIPFILVSTQAQTVIDCEIAEDRTEYCFRFNNPFQMYNDTQLIQMIDDASCG